MVSNNLEKLIDDVVASLTAARSEAAKPQYGATRVGFYMDAASMGVKAITEYGKLLVEPEREVVEKVLREVDIAGTQTEREDVVLDEEVSHKTKVGFY